MKVSRSNLTCPSYADNATYYSSGVVNHSVYEEYYGFCQSNSSVPTFYEAGTNFLHLFTTENVFNSGMNYVCLEKCELDRPKIYIEFKTTDIAMIQRFKDAKTFIGTDNCYIDWNTLRIYKIETKVITVFKLDPKDTESVFDMTTAN